MDGEAEMPGWGMDAPSWARRLRGGAVGAAPGLRPAKENGAKEGPLRSGRRAAPGRDCFQSGGRALEAGDPARLPVRSVSLSRHYWRSQPVSFVFDPLLIPL